MSLLASVRNEATFVVQACPGLALAIEQSALPAQASPAQQLIDQLLQTYTQAMGRFGAGPGEIDTLVLGCTHYVFVESAVQALLGPQVRLVSTGGPVARQTRRLLVSAQLLHPEDSAKQPPAPLLFTTGDLASLHAAAQRWLGLAADTCQAVPAPLQAE